MGATRDKIVGELDAYFGVENVTDDDWTSIFDVVYETPHWRAYVEPRWAQRFNGLMLKGADVVTKVATCVFPSDAIISRLAPGTFLFTEHPIDDAAGDVFAPLAKATFERCKRDGISIYTVHAPLDQHREVGPSFLIAKHLEIVDFDVFHRMDAGIPGGAAVVGNTAPSITVAHVAARLQSALGDDIPVKIAMGDGLRAAGRVAVVAGGGADVDTLEDALARGCNTYVTGNAASPCHIPFVRELHDAFRAKAAAAGIAVVDGTHYGTEKLSQLAMVDWFRERCGVDAVFEAGKPERS